MMPEEYLDIERNTGFRSEYYAGEMFAIPGATESHNLVVVNVVSELRQLLRHKPCRVYPSDMRVRVNAIAYTYPDAVALSVVNLGSLTRDETRS
jgi:Uma2 family endonuclease